MISGSSLQRILACPDSEFLPFRVDKFSEYAESGTRDHTRLAARLVAGELLGKDWLAEVKFAYDTATDTARVIESEGHRDYQISATEVPCTVDGFHPLERTIVDWKTGHGDVDLPPHNPQLLFGALCASRVFGFESVTVVIGKTFGRDPDDFEPLIYKSAVDLFAIDEFAARVRQAFAYRPVAARAYREGDHCTYCPGRYACPSYTAAIRAIGDVPSDQFVTHENAGAHFDTVKKMRRIIADYDTELQRLADQAPVTVSGGRTFERAEQPGNEKISAPHAFDAICQVIDPESAERAMPKTVSKKSICEAIASAGLPVQETEREILKIIRDSGGATRETIVKYGIVKNPK